MYTWDVPKTMWNKQRYCWQLQNHVWIQNFRRSNGKITMPGKSEYLFVVLWHGRSCQEMCGTILWVGKRNDTTTLQSIYSMPWRPSFQRRRIEIWRRIVKSMLSNCSEMFTLGTYWKTWYSMVSEKLARSITKWTKACDKRLNRLISYIHHTCEYKQYCHVRNTAKQCRLGLFQDSDFCRKSWGLKIYFRWNIVCIFGSPTFVPISWMCKKQTSVSHSSTEAEIMSLDAGSRMDGVAALTLWDLVIEVFHSVPNRRNVPRPRLCWRPWRFKINIMRNLVYFRKSNICSHKLDVQEANISVSQFYRIRNHFLRCRLKDRRYTRAWLWGSDRRSSSRKHVSEWSSTGWLVYISNAKENSWKDWWCE